MARVGHGLGTGCDTLGLFLPTLTPGHQLSTTQFVLDPVDLVGVSVSDFHDTPFSIASTLGGVRPGVSERLRLDTSDHSTPLSTPAQSTPVLPPASVEDERDLLWQSGTVYVAQRSPKSEQKAWPHGMYARDMARAFHLIGGSKGDDPDMIKERCILCKLGAYMLTVLARFQRIFPGVPYKHSTYYGQWTGWVNSTEEERKRVAEMSRTRQGLWTVCRKTMSGWRERRH